jgi:hypothetical protein
MTWSDSCTWPRSIRRSRVLAEHAGFPPTIPLFSPWYSPSNVLVSGGVVAQVTTKSAAVSTLRFALPNNNGRPGWGGRCR